MGKAGKFKLFDKGALNTVLLIPGWATDYRIFDTLDLTANRLVPVEFSPFTFERDLLNTMQENNLKKISIIGWSMGALLAADFSSKHREYINRTMLISVKGSYEKESIENVKRHLRKNRAAFLYKFYKDCFSPYERQALTYFKKKLLKSYINKMDIDTLSEGLNYLSESKIEPTSLCGLKITFVHGEEDKIAPIEDIFRLKNELTGSKFISIEKTGHMPFLRADFKEALLW